MKGSQTRDRLLDIGLRELSVHGLEGGTLGSLARASGLSKSGLFAHFASKSALQIDLLDRTAAFAQGHVVVPAMATAEGLPRLQDVVERWLGWSKKARLPGGCRVAAALFELDDLEGEVRDHVVALESRWRALLLTLVERAVQLGHLTASTDVAQFVWELFGIYLSHHAFARFLRDPDADRRAKTAFDALIARYSVDGGRTPKKDKEKRT